jgi:hypothetical protein
MTLPVPSYLLVVTCTSGGASWQQSCLTPIMMVSQLPCSSSQDHPVKLQSHDYSHDRDMPEGGQKTGGVMGAVMGAVGLGQQAVAALVGTASKLAAGAADMAKGTAHAAQDTASQAAATASDAASIATQRSKEIAGSAVETASELAAGATAMAKDAAGEVNRGVNCHTNQCCVLASPSARLHFLFCSQCIWYYQCESLVMPCNCHAHNVSGAISVSPS